MKDYSKIPERTLVTLNNYVNLRLPPGHFVTAVLTNDLFEAMGRADEENAIALREIVRYIWNEMPLACWGTKEKVKQWLSNESEL